MSRACRDVRMITRCATPSHTECELHGKENVRYEGSLTCAHNAVPFRLRGKQNIHTANVAPVRTDMTPSISSPARKPEPSLRIRMPMISSAKTLLTQRHVGELESTQAQWRLPRNLAVTDPSMT